MPAAIMGHETLRVLRASGGAAVAVSDAEIVAAFEQFGRFGICAGYESAATLAALGALQRDGIIPPGAWVLLLTTSTHLTALARSSGS